MPTSTNVLDNRVVFEYVTLVLSTVIVYVSVTAAVEVSVATICTVLAIWCIVGLIWFEYQRRLKSMQVKAGEFAEGLL